MDVGLSLEDPFFFFFGADRFKGILALGEFGTGGDPNG